MRLTHEWLTIRQSATIRLVGVDGELMGRRSTLRWRAAALERLWDFDEVMTRSTNLYVRPQVFYRNFGKRSQCQPVVILRSLLWQSMLDLKGLRAIVAPSLCSTHQMCDVRNVRRRCARWGGVSSLFVQRAIEKCNGLIHTWGQVWRVCVVALGLGRMSTDTIIL